MTKIKCTPLLTLNTCLFQKILSMGGGRTLPGMLYIETQ